MSELQELITGKNKGRKTARKIYKLATHSLMDVPGCVGDVKATEAIVKKALTWLFVHKYWKKGGRLYLELQGYRMSTEVLDLKG